MRTSSRRSLSRLTDLAVTQPQDGDPLRARAVFVLPPDRQATINCDRRLGFPLFARRFADSAPRVRAFALGDGVTAVILTGRLDAVPPAYERRSDALDAWWRRTGRPRRRSECREPRCKPCAFDFVLPLRTIAAALVALTTVPGAAELFRVGLGPWGGGRVVRAGDDGRTGSRILDALPEADYEPVARLLDRVDMEMKDYVYQEREPIAFVRSR